MTRFVHDQFAKQYLQELLTPLGEIETSRNTTSEVREIDVLFIPKTQPQEQHPLGLLAKLATNITIFEPYRNPVQPVDIRICISKLLDYHRELARQANRQDSRITESELPQLWILTPTLSAQILAGFGANQDLEKYPEGVYLLSPSLKTGIVVIHQLPRTAETLWLRVLGKGKVQKQAIAELRELPADNPWRLNALELLYNLLTILEARQDVEREDRELIMELSPLYLQRLENATQIGIQQGIQQGIETGRQEGIETGMQTGMQTGKRLGIENILRVRFGSLTPELEAIIEPILTLTPEEYTPLLLQLSREELLARFTAENSQS